MSPGSQPTPEAAAPTSSAKDHIALTEQTGAHNYAPLEVVLCRGEGAFVWDTDGQRYLDMLSAYSAINQGHCHPRLVEAMQRQAAQLALTSRAFYNDKLGPMQRALTEVTGMETVLPMNSGAEAVETAIKAMRRYGYEKLNIPENQAQIIVAEGNFHGRTISVVSFSTDADSYGGYGPFTPGFITLPYGDLASVERTLRDNPNVVGILVEPIQGEAGVVLPPENYLPGLRELCDSYERVLCLDEIQTGLGRTGRMFCFEHAGIHPDLLILGKALSGGMYPISAVAGPRRIMDVFTPGSHGSTFGGAPLAAAIATEALAVLRDEKLPERAAELGEHMLARLTREITNEKVKEIRGKGLLIAVEFHTPIAKQAVKALHERYLLAKDTHQTTIRFAPPLVIDRADLDHGIDIIVDVVNAA